MTLPFTLPPWMPWWVPILILVPAILYALIFLLMPFSVFGVKGRLDVIEARLDELQGEIRILSLRLGEPGRFVRPDEDAYDLAPLPAAPRAAAPQRARPPVPPAPDPYRYDDDPEPRLGRTARPVSRDREPPRPPRAEPRFDR
ncbi:hypothetical protein [Acidisoma sp. 7E03]